MWIENAIVCTIVDSLSMYILMPDQQKIIKYYKLLYELIITHDNFGPNKFIYDLLWNVITNIIVFTQFKNLLIWHRYMI